MLNAVDVILGDVDRLNDDGFLYQPLSKRDIVYTRALREAIIELGYEHFKVHPKGTGVIVTKPGGIPCNVAVCEYLGELYPAYRWCEKLDVIEQARARYDLKPGLPDFYNILLERPREDSNGYNCLFVDASHKANHGSTASHCCNSNCTSAVVARKNKLAIMLTTNRHVYYGEELTMDYYRYLITHSLNHSLTHSLTHSVTTSESEWREAICLCGMTSCRGSFLHYAAEDDLQQILMSACSPLWRVASLLRASCDRKLSEQDDKLLKVHGISRSLLGDAAPLWLKKFIAYNLKFIEFERKALPCALLRPKPNHEKSEYDYYSADLSARSVMEQRLQSIVCCTSMVLQVLKDSDSSSRAENAPMVILSAYQVMPHLLSVFDTIPGLLKQMIPLVITMDRAKSKVKSGNKKSNEVAEVKERDRLCNAIAAIDSILTAARDDFNQIPDSMKDSCRFSTIQDICTALRHELKKILHLNQPNARLRLLHDVLLLYKYTHNYSTYREYPDCQSEPITVLARDLGTSLDRQVIFGDKPSNSYSSKKCKLDANEPVFTSTKVYSKSFVFNQLMTWYNAKDDISKCNIRPLELLGCVHLPIPAQCFGAVEGEYNESVRHIFIEYLSKEMEHTKGLPAAVQKCFAPRNDSEGADEWEKIDCKTCNICNSKKNENKLLICDGCDEQYHMYCLEPKVTKLPPGDWFCPNCKNSGMDKCKPCCSEQNNQPMLSLFGSPMLDLSLGEGESMQYLLGELGTRSNVKYGDNTQWDNMLPPEDTTQWIQCNLCRKWRRIKWSIDIDSLPDDWSCSMLYWDRDKAACSADEDIYDPDAEIAVGFTATDKDDKLDVGSWRDVYCPEMKYFYEAVVVAIKHPTIECAAGDTFNEGLQLQPDVFTLANDSIKESFGIVAATNPLLSDMVSVVATDIVTDATEGKHIVTDAMVATDIVTDAMVATDIVTDAMVATDIVTDAMEGKHIVTDAMVATDIVTDAMEGKRSMKSHALATSNKRRKKTKIAPITKTRVKFHFKHWDDEFDEWIDYDSPRIQGHNLYTNPDFKTLDEQERWQHSCHYNKYQ